jgi:hypothetical protein
MNLTAPLSNKNIRRQLAAPSSRIESTTSTAIGRVLVRSALAASRAAVAARKQAYASTKSNEPALH